MAQVRLALMMVKQNAFFNFIFKCFVLFGLQEVTDGAHRLL